MGKTLLPFVMMRSFLTDPAALDRMLDSAIPDDTSVNRKRRKERARMLTKQREAELKANPKHRRGKTAK